MVLIKSLQIYPLTSLFLDYTLIVHSDLNFDAVFAEIKENSLIKYNSKMH